MNNNKLNKPKFFVIGGVTLLILMIILQNMASVETRILFLSVTMPRAALLVITLLVGFFLGLTAAFGLAGKNK